MTWWTVSGWLVFAVWLVSLVPSVVVLLFRSLCRQTAALEAPALWRSVSVIVPARDEAADVEQALRSLLAADYPDFEVLAVNDRSTDGTGDVMDRLANEEARLRVIHLTELPDGWLGKNHAIHVAAETARGEYLLFTDADVFFSPDAIRLAMLYVSHRRVDHLCLMPRMIPGGYWENSLVAFFGLIFILATQPWLLPTTLKRIYVGVGAFNLVRAEAYRQMGGHVPIRLDVLDDVKLGKLMKRSGYRQHLLVGGGAVRVKWQHSARGVIHGLEKNGFASMNYSLVQLSAATAVFWLLFVLPYVAVAVWWDERCLGYAATLLLVHVAYAGLGRIFGSGWSVLPALPIAALWMLFAFWRSAIVTLRQGGVRWRDTFYPLHVLRRHVL